MSPPASSRLLNLACSAIERYNGPLRRTLRALDPEGRKAQVAFPSARLGSRAADTPIKACNAPMMLEIAARMKAGGLETRWPRLDKRRRVMPFGEHPGLYVAAMSDQGQRPFRDAALVGGHLCLDVMRHVVRSFRNGGHLTPDERVVEIDGSIGVMRRRLRFWLERNDVAGGEGR